MSTEKIVLKIYFLDSYRTIAFDPEITVHAAIALVKQKWNLSEKEYSVHGLYLVDESVSSTIGNVPSNNGGGGLLRQTSANGVPSVSGVWMNEAMVLAQTGVTSKSHIEFRSKMRFVKVTNIAKEAVKTMMVDETVPLKEYFGAISQLMGMEENPEFSLQTVRIKDNVPFYNWLDLSKTTSEQFIADDGVVIYRKKFHVTDSFIEAHAPSDLHMLYLECKQAIVSGLYSTSVDQALAFSALQLQSTYGNYDPLRHVSGFLMLSECLPPEYASVAYIEEDVYKAHRKLKDLSALEVKQRYVKLCYTLPTYGITHRNARETNPAIGSEYDLVVGVNCDAFFTLHIGTKDVITRMPLLELTAFGARGKFLTVQFGSKSREFLFESELDAQLITSLLAGYITFKRNKRKELFAQNLFSRQTSVSGASTMHEATNVFHSPILRFSVMPVVGVLSMNGIRFELENQKPNTSFD